ncbi:hypothetical protein B0A48_12773 [Cryoendolithus antarcticus]|uniref:Uncharacterized protein n=1 Tax=Cryoendolithus antarcticus TaxID=1507870 RepID=A0A1V8SRF1_9PEZI|nr:hypothetical protein B0A48_12773 [Cryoendolithus antarcticus]
MKEILPHTASWSDEYTWKASLPDICEGLALSLSVLSDYWSRCLSALRHLPTAHASKLDFSSFESTYPEDYFAQAAAALPFISWLVQQLLHRPSYAGFIERTLRGWHGDALDLTTFEWYLLLTNIFGLTQILQAKTYKERKNVVVNGLRQLDPKASVRWRERWREVEFEVDGEQALGHKEMQSLVALIRTLGNVKAFAVPLGEGAPFGGYGHSREAMQYLRELASRSDLGPPRMTYSE